MILRTNKNMLHGLCSRRDHKYNTTMQWTTVVCVLVPQQAQPLTEQKYGE